MMKHRAYIAILGVLFMPGWTQADAPVWATKLRDLQNLLVEGVVQWWIDHPPCDNHGDSGSGELGGQLQIGNGEFGGSLGDDVELTNGWDTFFLTAHDKAIAQSLRWNYESVWSDGSDWRYTDRDNSSGTRYNVLWHGYMDGWDRCPEHAPENAVYSTPHMMLIEYGNPRYVEQAMDTAEHFWVWTKVNPAGDRHFRSYRFSAFDAFDVKPEGEGGGPSTDVVLPYADPDQQWSIGEVARPMKSGHFLLWYNQNPSLKTGYEEFYEAWLDKARRTEDGKPYGVLPAGVTWATDALGGGTDDWMSAVGHHSYDWEQVWPMQEIHSHFVAAERLFGRSEFLEPAAAVVEYTLGIRDDSILDFSWYDVLAQYRALSGDTTYDSDILKKPGSDRNLGYPRFLATGDKQHLADALQSNLNFVQERIHLWTEHPDMVEVDKGKKMYEPIRFVSAMFTGGDSHVRSRYPGMVLTWENTGYDFAALVLGGQRDTGHLKVLAYNFDKAPKQIGMRVWQLAKGRYELQMGPDANGDDEADTLHTNREVELFERGQSVVLDLPPQELTVIEMSQTAEAGLDWTGLTDLAVATGKEHEPRVRKLPLENNEYVSMTPEAPIAGRPVSVTLRIHNISSQDAPSTQVSVFEGLPHRPGEQLTNQASAAVPAPKNLDLFDAATLARGWPRFATVTLDFVMPASETFFIMIDPYWELSEISKRNNILAYKNGRLVSPVEIEASGDFSLYPAVAAGTCDGGGSNQGQVKLDARLAADNAYELYFNGQLVGTGADWWKASSYRVSLDRGKNLVAVKATDRGGLAAMIAELSWSGPAVVTDSSWKVSRLAQPGWTEVGFDDGSWGAATSYGVYGVGPWKKRVTGLPDDSDAHWIWTADNHGDDTVYFRYEIVVAEQGSCESQVDVDEPISEELIATLSADNAYELYVNGQLLGTGVDWWRASSYRVSLDRGKNLVAVKAADTGGLAAMIAELSWSGPAAVTDSSWKVSKHAQPGWTDVGFDDGSWEAATSYGVYGVGPWKKRVKGLTDDSDAHWIWTADNHGDDTVYFRYEIVVDE